MKKHLLYLIFASVMLTTLLSACQDTPPELTAPAGPIPVPSDVTLLVAPGRVTVNWSFDAVFAYSEFAVTRSEDGAAFAEVARVAQPPWVDTTVRDGVTYTYRVSGVDADGVSGSPSPPASIQVATYAVFIEAGAAVTSARNVLLSFTAPGSTRDVRVSSDSLMAGVPWRSYAGSFPFTLAPTDGVKRVYAQFIDASGNQTAVVSDDIVLDTFADISSLSVTCSSGCLLADTLSPGSTIHIHVNTAGNERNGIVDVFIEGQGATPVQVHDDGRLGDAIAGDGVYELDYTFATSFRQRSMRLSAVFHDEAGNESAERDFSTTLYMSDPPVPVFLYPVSDSTATSVTLRWTRSDDTHFARYEVYRNTALPVELNSAVLAGSVPKALTNTFTDSGVADSTAYFYRVFVVNDLDERAGSGTRSVSALRP